MQSRAFSGLSLLSTDLPRQSSHIDHSLFVVRPEAVHCRSFRNCSSNAVDRLPEQVSPCSIPATRILYGGEATNALLFATSTRGGMMRYGRGIYCETEGRGTPSQLPLFSRRARRHQGQIAIYSDHLDSIHALVPDEQPRALALLLIQHIWQSSPCEPTLRHVRAYTHSQTIPSQLKRLADHLATRANSLSLPPPSFPPFSPTVNIDAANLDTSHEPFPSYSMVIHIYAQLGKPHSFVECPQFSSLRLLRASELHSNFFRILEASPTDAALCSVWVFFHHSSRQRSTTCHSIPVLRTSAMALHTLLTCHTDFALDLVPYPPSPALSLLALPSSLPSPNLLLTAPYLE